jgi:hypothetical protein
MTYRRSGSLWSLLRTLFNARAANRRRRPAGERGMGARLRRVLRRWLRA